MPAQKSLILVPSERMDNNKKEGRHENGLVRMSKKTRDHMGFNQKSVELFPQGDVSDIANKTMLLDIHQAYTADIKKLRAEGYSAAEIKKVGFVTTPTFNKITGKNGGSKDDVWITEDFAVTVIGADPEFLLFNEEGSIIRASNVMGYHGQLGSDGAMAEVRPKPAITPEDLTKNIQVLFENDNLVENIKPYLWRAGCYFKDQNRDYPIGGHIHIGNPVRIAKMPTTSKERFFKVFNKIIDEMLSIPMIKIDGTKLGKARRSECTMATHGNGFGRFGRYRLCNGRLEHRTLSGMWLLHPTLATMVFGTAKAIIDEVFTYTADNKFDTNYLFPEKLHGRQIWQPNFNDWAEIPLAADLGCVKSSDYMTNMLNNSPAEKITKKFLTEWYSRMKGLTTYKKYAKYVDGLYEILKINTKAFHDYKPDLKRAWVEGEKFI